MRILQPSLHQQGRRSCRLRLAYTFMEVIVATMLLGLVMASMYFGFSFGFTLLGSVREDLRATQILVRRMEAIRLYTWSQVLDTNYIQPFFVEPYDPLGVTNNQAGVLYTGNTSVTIPSD